jgi:hypothetical protein
VLTVKAQKLSPIARLYGITVVALGVLVCIALVWVMVAGLLNDLATAGPVIAAAVALAVFAAGEVFTRQRVAQQYRWDKIADDYEGFVELVRTMGDTLKENNGELPQETLERMGKFSDKLMMWGTPDVIRAWRDVKRAADEDLEPAEAMMRFGAVLVAIRKDLGHNRNLDVRDLLGVTINDIDDHISAGVKL